MATVLVVEDDQVILRLLEINLELEGYDVVLAEDGVEGVEVARRVGPDLILLDVMMPRMDGLAVVSTLRSDPAFADTPMVVLSAKAQQVDRDRGTAAGADAYVTKPFDPETLLALVADLLAGRRPT